ncbi:hypothetical protein GPECTOR_940g197 [Gonium pectorale]|uniref:Uncharacterized protein n=1 Tax=Gonium pectorale TaxID=33097 RepID=A0A150FTU7_GONPE|nr:hypothetical protein GPECTOR_940g197 [Gonium pectorale]|eukprot:KXZ41034.1 hypothetical protein GPECTOR_940g197 [Gonium pectorale]
MPRASPGRPSVVPEDILNELRQLEASLDASSRLDGRRRATLQLTADRLPAPLPPHTLEPGLPTLDALVRPPTATGRTACKWLRKLGRVPGRVYSLPAAAVAEAEETEAGAGAAAQERWQQQQHGRAGGAGSPPGPSGRGEPTAAAAVRGRSAGGGGAGGGGGTGWAVGRAAAPL